MKGGVALMTSSIKAELTKRSPLRILEKSISGGLGAGNVAVIASPKGVGKTACLVHIAADKLIQDKPVLHVSYSGRVDYIINWYEDIFKELSKQPTTRGALEIYEDIIKNRVIMNFKQDGVRTEQVLKSLEAMIVQGRFAAAAIIVDGLDFTAVGPEGLKAFKDFAGRLGLEIWFSASLRGEQPLYDENGIPNVLKAHMDSIDVLLTLQQRDDYVQMSLISDHGKLAPKDLRLKLDPRTLLIVKDKRQTA
jgi:hypothetical protein